jgi:hypothetical protein
MIEAAIWMGAGVALAGIIAVCIGLGAHIVAMLALVVIITLAYMALVWLLLKAAS